MKYIEGENSRIKDMHEITANMNMLKEIGWNGDNVPDTYIPIKEVPGMWDKKYIGICAGFDDSENFRWRIKNWGYDNYARLIEKLIKEYPDYDILIIGTGNDNKMLQYIKPDIMKAKRKKVIDCVDQYSIQESAYLVSKCSAVICNDTGISHVASAVNTHVYVIFGPTDQVKNTPQRNSIIISKNMDCQPCQYKSKWNTCETIECMDIKPDDVMKMFNKYFMQKFNSTKDLQRKKDIQAECKYHFYTVAHGERFINAAIRSANSFIHFNPDIRFTILCLIDEMRSAVIFLANGEYVFRNIGEGRTGKHTGNVDPKCL